jgi:hypothetical protein
VLLFHVDEGEGGFHGVYFPNLLSGWRSLKEPMAGPEGAELGVDDGYFGFVH